MIFLIKGLLAVAVALVLGVLLVIRIARRSEAENNRSQMDIVIGDILDAVGVTAENGRRAALASEIRAALETKTDFQAPELASVLRIECAYTKTGEGSCRRDLVVLSRKAEGLGSKKTLTRTVGWEYLDGEVRKEFITSGKQELIALLYQKKEG